MFVLFTYIHGIIIFYVGIFSKENNNDQADLRNIFLIS